MMMKTCMLAWPSYTYSIQELRGSVFLRFSLWIYGWKYGKKQAIYLHKIFNFIMHTILKHTSLIKTYRIVVFLLFSSLFHDQPNNQQAANLPHLTISANQPQANLLARVLGSRNIFIGDLKFPSIFAHILLA